MCGQTESGPAGLFSTDAQMRARPSASGHQGEPFVEVRVVDRDGNTVPSGTVGELLFRGETVMKGYWRRPEETAATIRDGWLHTGDLVRVEADGSYTMVDRLKDMIITGGRNVYSVEVEQAIASHPDVLECAVIASPHELFGESILAVVNPRPGRDVTLSSLKQHCRQLIADYKLPHLLVLDRIPRNANGKVQKAVLRRAYAQPSPKGSP
jgi:fatty-acyl-CoA synthase